MPGMTTTTIAEAVEAWPGVHGATGSRGEYSFRVGAREIGHLHGERVLHIGLPKAVWHELHDAGRIDYHPVFPGKPGFGARAIRDEADRRDAIAILRLNYERVIERHGLPTP
jgi:hypothetical protein